LRKRDIFVRGLSKHCGCKPILVNYFTVRGALVCLIIQQDVYKALFTLGFLA